jgi:hypothetical protein
LNKFASLENYQQEITKATPTLFKNAGNKTSEFSDIFIKVCIENMFIVVII